MICCFSLKVKKAYFLKGKNIFILGRIQSSSVSAGSKSGCTLGRREYRWVSPRVGFGTREAHVLLPSETGITAVPEGGTATQPPTTSSPSVLSLQVWGGWIVLFLDPLCCVVCDMQGTP